MSHLFCDASFYTFAKTEVQIQCLKSKYLDFNQINMEDPRIQNLMGGGSNPHSWCNVVLKKESKISNVKTQAPPP